YPLPPHPPATTRFPYTTLFRSSGAVDASGQPVARIATQTGAAVVLQDSSGRPIGSWGWNDAGWVGLASPFIFSQTGPQTLRIQRSEEHTSELQSRFDLVCRLLL